MEVIEQRVSELEMKIKFLENKMSKQEKTIKKLKKDVLPESDKKVKKPSGFAKPTYISPEMCEFLKEAQGTELPRTEVTKRIIEYVKENDLQDKVNKKNINLNDTLNTLLKPTNNDPITYFTIQRLLKHHYVKPETGVPVVVEPVPEPVPEPVVKPKRTRKPKSSAVAVETA